LYRIFGWACGAISHLHLKKGVWEDVADELKTAGRRPGRGRELVLARAMACVRLNIHNQTQYYYN
jgi:hypothetical protein